MEREATRQWETEPQPKDFIMLDLIYKTNATDEERRHLRKGTLGSSLAQALWLWLSLENAVRK